jgi:Fe-S-cluster containining protein
VIEGRYLDIVAAVDSEFSRNRRLHGDRIQCRAGCTDCCHHIFEITEIEAAYIAKGVERLDAPAREALKSRARAYMDARRDLPAAGARLACPALEQGVCSIYEFRPLMCHKFGMPLFNPERPDRILACELNFKDGEEIDDPQLIQIQTGIHQAWKELRSEYTQERGGLEAEGLNVARAILEDFPSGVRA